MFGKRTMDIINLPKDLFNVYDYYLRYIF